MQRLTHPQSQHLEDPVQSLSREHVCSVISAGHSVGSETYGHTPGRTIKSAKYFNVAKLILGKVKLEQMRPVALLSRARFRRGLPL